MMHGYCNMCGKCCEAIRIGVTKDHIHESALRQPNGIMKWAFIDEHWHPMSEENAFDINPLLRLQKEAGLVDDYNFYYSCDMYDKETHKCTARSDRPFPCRAYPYINTQHTGKVGEHMTWYSATCGYINDETVSPGERQLMLALAEEIKSDYTNNER